MEDLIAREDVVVTITRTGYAKRTKTDLYRAQKRGGKGVQGAGAASRTTSSPTSSCSSTHDWILFFTNKGRVYRAKAYELPEATADRDAASTSPTCWPSSRTSRSPRSSRSRATRSRRLPRAGHPQRPR